MKPLLFCLSMFHTITLERRKYGSMGWNIPYPWMISDFLTSRQQLELYLQDCDEVPFETLQFLLGIINYGGRITDYNDEKLIISLLKAFFNQDSLRENYCFMENEFDEPLYKIPDTKTLDNVKEYIATLPFNDEPEIFGLHKNAKINFNIQTSRTIENFMLKFEPSNAGEGSGGSLNDEVLKLVKKFKSMVPSDISQPQKKATDSLLIFRDQEALRFNHLLNVIRNSLD